MSKTTHYELNTPIGSEVLSVMTGLNPNFTTIDNTMYDNETRSTQALNKANVNEQNIATALGRITTAEGDIDTLESGLETANTNISGLTSRMGTAETNIVSANNRIQENTGSITQINSDLSEVSNRVSANNISGSDSVDLQLNVEYIAPYDGYVGAQASGSDSYCYISINDIGLIRASSKAHSSTDTVFVRKGMRIKLTQTYGTFVAHYIPIKN